MNRKTAILALLLLVLVTLVYWPGLSGGFIFDDFPNIVTNTAVHAERLTWENVRRAAHAYEPGVYGRPLATLSFALDYYIGGGKDAWQFKLTSLVVHLLNTLLVFWLLRRVLSLPRAFPKWGASAAAVIALFWAIHPLQVSAVLYVVQRMETLSLTFVLLALITYLHGRSMQCDGRNSWPWLLASLLLAGIGMLSKETAILFPLYALAIELTLLRFDARSDRTRRLLMLGYIAGISTALLVFAIWVLPRYLDPQTFYGRDFTLYERLLTQLRVLPMYLGQMTFPVPSALTFYYDTYPKSTGWLHPATTLLGGVFLVALITAAWRLRRHMPLVSLGIFWFFAAHALTSNVFNLELVFEHRNYFALLGVLIAAADLVRRIPLHDGPALKYVAIGAITIAFGFLALLRAATWGGELNLATELAMKNRLSPRASSDLGTLYFGMADGNPQSPFFKLAQNEFERGSRLPNASPLPEQGLILMAATAGEPARKEWWDRFVEKVRTRPPGPQELLAVTGLMSQRYQGTELDDARLSEAYLALLSKKGMPAHLYATYGDFALTYLKDDALADRMFVAAIERAPDDAAYAEKLVGTLVADGHIRQAKLVMERAYAMGLLDNKGG